MLKRPRFSKLLFVYVGFLFCIGFDDVTQMAFGIQGMSGIVSILVAVIGAVVAYHIWKAREKGACLGLLGAVVIGILWTSLPVVLSFMFGGRWDAIPTDGALRRISEYSGAAIGGMVIWMFLIVLKDIVLSVWRSLFVKTENPPA